MEETTVVEGKVVVTSQPQLDPAVQAQLEGRVYRPGQRRDVKIVHLFTNGTLEEQLVRRIPEFAA